jgi:1,4-dihydroxy-2-naphthoate octaprenyltransferase
MAAGVAAAFSVAGVGGAYLTAAAGPVVPVIGVASLIAALTYTGGPFPYGYHGLGEAFVFVFFGLVATVGTRFVFDETAPGSAWLGGVIMGFLAASILVANNIRDIETDAVAGKRTLAVIIGRGKTRGLYTALVISAFAAAVVGVIAGVFPPNALLVLIAAPLAIAPIRSVAIRTDGPSLISALKGTARLQLAAAVLLGLGLIV